MPSIKIGRRRKITNAQKKLQRYKREVTRNTLRNAWIKQQKVLAEALKKAEEKESTEPTPTAVVTDVSPEKAAE